MRVREEQEVLPKHQRQEQIRPHEDRIRDQPLDALVVRARIRPVPLVTIWAAKSVELLSDGAQDPQNDEPGGDGEDDDIDEERDGLAGAAVGEEIDDGDEEADEGLLRRIQCQ
jgi:hypothetical protein